MLALPFGILLLATSMKSSSTSFYEYKYDVPEDADFEPTKPLLWRLFQVIDSNFRCAQKKGG